MLQLFDKQLTLKMGQANVRRWVDDIVPLLERDDDVPRRRVLRHPPRPAQRGAAAYEMFQKKQDGAFKVVFQP